MVRKLKFHEQKLLKKVDFINWEVDNNLHEVKVMRRYCIQVSKYSFLGLFVNLYLSLQINKYKHIYLSFQKREDYTMYNKLSREIRDIVRRIKDLVGIYCFLLSSFLCLAFLQEFFWVLIY